MFWVIVSIILTVTLIFFVILTCINVHYQLTNNRLKDDIDSSRTCLKILTEEKEKLGNEISFYNDIIFNILIPSRDDLKANIKELEKVLLYLEHNKELKVTELHGIQQNITNMNDSLDILTNRLNKQKDTIISNYKNIIETEKSRLTTEFELFKTNIENERENISKSLENLHNLELLVIQEKTNREETTKRNMLCFGDRGISEMKELFGICYKLSNPVPLYKAIYDIYIKNYYNDLVARLGVKGVCGIYKITNVVNGKVYVGQSVDVGERWKQHIKRGTGCEVGTISGSKLYDAIMQDGIWNFSFELLEEVEKERLTAQEKFWINHFSSVEYGYNMKN